MLQFPIQIQSFDKFASTSLSTSQEAVQNDGMGNHNAGKN